MKLTAVLVLGMLGLLLGIIAPPVQAQDSPVMPERTAEAEATAQIDPNILSDRLIFTAPGSCRVTPQYVVTDDEVFKLPSGQLLYALQTTIELDFHILSQDGRYMAGTAMGLFDLTTGEAVRSLNPESRAIAFSPDNRLVTDKDGVYLNSTGETVLDLTTTVGDDGIEVTTLAEFLPNSDIFVRYTHMTSPTTSTWAVAYSGQDFTPIFDTRDYASPYAFHQFNADMSLVVIGNGGVFSYPDMTLIYDLSDSISLWAYFTQDRERAAFVSAQSLNTAYTAKLAVITLETAAVINEFEVEVPFGAPHEVFTVAEDISTVSIVQFGVGADGNPRYTGYHTFDTITGELVSRRSYDQWESSRGRGGLLPPFARPVNTSWEAGNYYIDYLSNAVNVGVFDLETRQLIMSMEGREAVQLVGDGEYVIAQNPCTVWELP